MNTINKIRQKLRLPAQKRNTEIDEMVKRIGMTGALTDGSIHLERMSTWQLTRITEQEMDDWLTDPEYNPARDRARLLAKKLLGIEQL